MAEAPFLMAECGTCGWTGPAHQRRSKDNAPAISCPTCGARARPWALDLGREQKILDRLQGERVAVQQKALEAQRAARLAHERLKRARDEVVRCRARLALIEVDHPGNILASSEAKRALLAAEAEEAEAGLAHAQATARVQVLG